MSRDLRPPKPHPDFPLGAWPNGQWGKKIKGKPYYFGTWKNDPKGEAALQEYQARLPGILNGTDHLRTLPPSGTGFTLGDLMKLYLVQRRSDVLAGTLSRIMYGDYVRELGQLVTILGEHTPVASLEPQHFALYVTRLSESRSLKARARKRAFALVKAMFIWGAGNGHCPLPEFGTALKAPIVTKQAIRKEKARAGVEDFSDRILTGAEIDKLVEHSQPNMAAMILLGVNTGLGPADIGRIRWRNIDFATGKLDYPRGKNGNDRIGYVWNRTRTALLELRKLRRTKAAYAKDGDNALIFVTRKGEAYYREEDRIEGGVVTGVKISNSVSITFGRLAKSLKLKGVTFYRLRHTFKTLGKRAKDRDALYLAMGHTDNSAAASYDHEEVSFKRTKRVALKVKGSLWPKPKAAGGSGSMRIGESVAA